MIIGLDMDGVLVNFVQAAGHRVNALWGIDADVLETRAEQLHVPRIEMLIAELLPFEISHAAICAALFQPGFFLSMLPMPGAVQAARELHEAGHELVVVTKSSLSWGWIAEEKHRWLEMHLKDIPYTTIIVDKMRAKHLVNLDIIVDDDPDALEHPSAYPVCMAYPWNVNWRTHSTSTWSFLYHMRDLPAEVAKIVNITRGEE